MNTTYFLNCVAGNLFKTKVSPSLPSAYYIGLSTTAPAADGSGVSEPSAVANYSRVQISSLGEPSNGVVQNTQEIRFNESSSDWGTITHYVIYDSGAIGHGNLLMYGELDRPRIVDAASIMTLQVGTLKLSVQNPSTASVS